jgi:hypothetical protein
VWGAVKSAIDVQVSRLWLVASLSILLSWAKGDADFVIYMPIRLFSTSGTYIQRWDYVCLFLFPWMTRSRTAAFWCTTNADCIIAAELSRGWSAQGWARENKIGAAACLDWSFPVAGEFYWAICVVFTPSRWEQIIVQVIGLTADHARNKT